MKLSRLGITPRRSGHLNQCRFSLLKILGLHINLCSPVTRQLKTQWAVAKKLEMVNNTCPQFKPQAQPTTRKMRFAMGQAMGPTARGLTQQVLKCINRSSLQAWSNLRCVVHMQIRHSTEALALRRTQCVTQWTGVTTFQLNRTRIESKANVAQARKYHTQPLLNQSTSAIQLATLKDSRTMPPSRGASVVAQSPTSQLPLRNKQIAATHHYNIKKSWRSAAMRLVAFCTKNTIRPATSTKITWRLNSQLS